MADNELRYLPTGFLEFPISDEPGTHRLANDLAMVLRPGDVICLSGDLGAGKSTFARALIRSFAGDPDLEVPSPTFTLVQSYEFDRFDLSHFDLYRLEDPEELEELGLEDLLETGVALIEWPEMAEDLLPRHALWVQITQPEEDGDRRRFTFFSENSEWQTRIKLTLAIRDFLDTAQFAGAERRFLAGDASLRTFETVTQGADRAVLMRWPFHDGALSAPIRAYMEKVHLAQDCRSVIAIGSELRDRGFLAAEIYAADLDNGLILSQDLGSETIVEDGKPVPERYRVAVDILARMHGQSWPATVKVRDGKDYKVPAYSTEALIAEASLFLDWYVPEVTGQPADQQTRLEFETLWRTCLERVASAQHGWVLRDFHSPNLLWQQEADGLNRIGLIDLQDTVIGPVAYDVASLLFDARTDICEELETGLLDAYVSARENQSSEFDRSGFSNAYSVMAAQRNSKLLGIFVRLARRDGKPAYLRHLPRILGYLDRVLDRPGMSDLKDWYARYRT
ncbi:MAG: tRNA (adenosine(37)-N6)-threonylcarbamoyltransferase complex ATPase subunit type 1 TsaE [Roseibium sp.]|uniref:tRNA (adenosine(37)-N6)-threonylcarbamoyltransferase complex ATPase subunit type 1 TsaE n=1 Tax=Roseibium sp. TaxID=1936156 RepID=UPI00260948B1|nr:tRNA (adenosine(37)-N6)-threonylcarbamoyltransferase complex ATPase subunit type 1 TsaE [Roseibium sp.]MCV0425904.1 tRNA (adenosine(37)-N6)-threonylcarbamoyltransferase complex ATPase subunit type 1 TsaE [Roseibium sp.]